jgi:hypothetical protein
LQVVIIYSSPNGENGARQIASEIAGFHNGSEAIVVEANLRDVNAPEI